jgi:hypothetical protein
VRFIRRISSHIDDGVLLAYRDGEIPAAQRQTVEAHINTCEACQSRFEQLDAQAAAVTQHMALLKPTALEASEPRRALATLRTTIYERKELTMLDRLKTSRQAQRTLATVLAVVIFVGAFAFPQVRALASDFLGLFRVQNFAFVNVDPERIDEIANAMESIQPGQFSHIGDPENSTEVATLDEAAQIVGFTPRTAPGEYSPSRYLVHTASTATFVPDVAALREVLTILNLDPALLPDNIDGQTFTFHQEAGVVQVYQDADGQHLFSIMQAPSPSIEGPNDVDIERLGKVMLMVLGMDEDEAERMSQEIDWTSTLVIPVPTNLASVQEVEVDGVRGLLFDAQNYHNEETGEFREATGGVLMWQKDGYIYAIMADNMNNTQMQELANSLE